MKPYKIALVVVFNLVISLGFYIKNENARIQDISSDLANIIPVCKKMDNPSLYENDLYLNNIDNVKYYTPFYVQPLRFIANFTHHDYLDALNILGLITHIIYGILWFFLYYSLKKDFWLAFIFSIFTRGVLWPPGGELLGISDLWTIMPRTLFIALLPLPFLIYLNFKKNNLIVTSIVLGFIFNFHAISGVGAILLYLFVYITYLAIQKTPFKEISKKVVTALLFCFIGMIPFLLTYASNVSSEIILDKNTLNTALHSRISDIFFDPILFIKSWHRPVTYILGFLFLTFFFFDISKNKQTFKILFFSALGIFIAANASVYIELFINTIFKKNILLSFQLIRFQKFVLVLFQIGIFLLGVELFNLLKIQNSIKISVFCIYIGLLSFSNNQIFDQIPLLSDDVTRAILPRNLQFFKSKPTDYSYSDMVDYIAKNTKKEDVFYGYNSFLIRAGASRAVVLDSKGASMLIEGNQKQFIKWHFDYQKLNALPENQIIRFLKSKKVDYVVSKTFNKKLHLVKKIKAVYLYKL